MVFERKGNAQYQIGCKISFQPLVDFLQLLDSVHGHVGVDHDIVVAERPSLKQVGDEWGSHDLGDQLDQEGEADQGEHDGQGGVEESLAGEPDVSVGTETKAATRGST